MSIGLLRVCKLSDFTNVSSCLRKNILLTLKLTSSMLAPPISSSIQSGYQSGYQRWNMSPRKRKDGKSSLPSQPGFKHRLWAIVYLLFFAIFFLNFFNLDITLTTFFNVFVCNRSLLTLDTSIRLSTHSERF